MSKWANFYRDRLNSRYERHIEKKYGEFINAIADSIYEMNHYGIVPKVVELGGGIGSITKALLRRRLRANYFVIDNCSEMLQLASMNIGDRYDVKFQHGDIRNKQCTRLTVGDRRADIVHSHGVLEHFNDQDIKTIINNWISQIHFHYVPGHKYSNKSFGDERLMCPRTWEKLTNSWVVEFNDGYDYMLIR